MSQKNVALQPGTLLVQATELTNRDTDFDGHGPNMYLNVSLYVPNEYQLGLYCHVRFEEKTSDWTTWQGSFTGVLLDVRNEGINSKIVEVVTPPFNDAKTLNGYGVHHFDYGSGGIVQSVDAIGDSSGGVFGEDDHPQVTLLFNNITITVQDPPPLADGLWFKTYIPMVRGLKIRKTPTPEKVNVV